MKSDVRLRNNISNSGMNQSRSQAISIRGSGPASPQVVASSSLGVAKKDDHTAALLPVRRRGLTPDSPDAIHDLKTDAVPQYCEENEKAAPPPSKGFILLGISLVMVTLQLTFVFYPNHQRVLPSLQRASLLDAGVGNIDKSTGSFYNTARCRDYLPPVDCFCPDPAAPQGPEHMQQYFKTDATWKKAHEANVLIASSAPKLLDIAFVGDSTLQHWSGVRTEAPPRPSWLRPYGENFRENFGKGRGYEGIILGNGKDTSQQLLWRLQNGEMPKSLQPRVWWVLIGTNDFDMNGCSENSVYEGVIAVVEEIIKRRPQADVVINGILPKSSRDEPDVLHRDKGLLSLIHI